MPSSPRVWFPNMFMTLISALPTKRTPECRFRVPPRMTKWDIKEYLLKA
ncbi:unnamed protein product, partial [Phaeothamnion confervicola]